MEVMQCLLYDGFHLVYVPALSGLLLYHASASGVNTRIRAMLLIRVILIVYICR
jgi:hypothetical protein